MHRAFPGIRFYIVILAILSVVTAAHAQELDQYGGWTGLKGHNTSGYFRVEKINGRYWLVTPDNNVFWSIGHCVTQYYDTWGGYAPTLGYYPNPYGNKAKYNGDQSAWISAVKARNAAWKFNTSAAWGVTNITGYPECVRVLFIRDRASALGCRMVSSFPDVFDPKFAQACDDQAKSLQSNATNPWTIGSFPDNELPWTNLSGYNSLPDAYIAFPEAAYGKQYWVNTFLKGKYSTIADLNTAYGTSFTDWTGDGSTVIKAVSLPDDAAFPARLNDKLDFMEVIAEQYYQLTTTKMRQYDPNHLVFSARWAMWWNGYGSAYHKPFNERIWKKAGQYCDVFANNGYVDFSAAETYYQHSSRVFQNAKKPFMITEHAYLANDSYFRYNSGWLPTQMDRAINHQNHMKAVLDLGVTVDPNDGQSAKTCMGLHWFQYYDEPSLGRPDGEAAQFGLLNVKDEAFTPLVDVMSTVHGQIYGYAALGQPIVVPNAPSPVRPVGASMQKADLASSFEQVYYPDDTAFRHSTGSLVDDPDAVKGKAWKAVAGTGSNTYMQYGPYVPGTSLWPSSSCSMKFRLKCSTNTNSSVVATVDATSSSGTTVYASRQIKGTDFAAANSYQEFAISFSVPAAPVPDQWEFRVQFSGAADVWVDTTTVSFIPSANYKAGPLSDGISTTFWSSRSYTSPDAVEWAAVDLGSVKSGVSRIVIVPGSTTSSGMPVDFRMEYSQDGIAWTTVPDQVYTAYVNNGGPFTLEFSPVQARYIRVYATKLGTDIAGKYRLQIADIIVSELTGTSTPTFEWTAVPGSASYTLLYSPEQGFPDEQTIRVDGITTTTYTPTVPISPGVWYWTVRSVDTQGRGGHYFKTVQFNVGNLPETQLDSHLAMRGEQVTCWPVTDNNTTAGDGTVWVFRDTTRKVEGDSSIKAVFTVNSLNKYTNQKNTGTSAIPLNWKGSRWDYSSVSQFTFKLYPQRYVEVGANIVSPSRFLRFKMVDSEAGVVVDVPVDPTGTLPKDTWSTVSIPLGSAVRNRVTKIVFYINCGDSKLAWDERMIFNLDDITPGILLDDTPPGTPVVTDSEPISLPDGELGANWSAQDLQSGISGYEYCIGTTPGTSNVLPWTHAGMQTSITNTNLELTPGNNYYYSVRATNGDGMLSSTGTSPGTAVVSSYSLGNVHNNPNGTTVQIDNALVTASNTQLANIFYVEAIDRSSAIQVYNTTFKPRLGDLVRLSGLITSQLGERLLWYPTTTTLASGKPVPEPFYVSGRALSGTPQNPHTPAIYEGIGLYNVGLLIRTSGKVTHVNTTGKFFYIDDGSGRDDKSGYKGVRVMAGSLASGNVIQMPLINSYVVVTGISSAALVSSRYITMIRLRNQADLTVLW